TLSNAAPAVRIGGGTRSHRGELAATAPALRLAQSDLDAAIEVATELRFHRLGELDVFDQDIELVVGKQTRNVEVRGTDAAPPPVDDHGLGMKHRPAPLEDAHARR